MEQGFGKTFLVGTEPVFLFADVPTGIWLALDQHRNDAIGSPKLFKIKNLFGDIDRFCRAGAAEHDHVFAAFHGGANRLGKISIGRQFLFVTKDREKPLRNDIAPFINLSYKILRDFVGLKLLMQPGGPLAAQLLVVEMAIGDKSPVFQEKLRVCSDGC